MIWLTKKIWRYLVLGWLTLHVIALFRMATISFVITGLFRDFDEMQWLMLSWVLFWIVSSIAFLRSSVLK